jgi:glucokinase
LLAVVIDGSARLILMKQARDPSLYIGLDIGRMIRGAVVRDDSVILNRQQVVAEVKDPQAFIQQLVDMFGVLAAEAGGPAGISSVGIGWPGLVNRHLHRLEVTPNMLDLSSVDLYRELSVRIPVPIAFENDANAGAYGEWQAGAAKGLDDVLYVSLGTGIGCGLILGGQLQRGSLGFGGEFGHFKIEPGGLECGCGSTGCLETMVSGPNIVRRVREHLFSDPSFSVSQLARDMEATLTCERIKEAARENDDLAKAVLRETGVFVGMAIASVINLLNVEMVVMGGGVMTAGDVLLEPIREETRSRTIAPAFDCCRIVAGRLGQDAGIVGAATLARDRES